MRSILTVVITVFICIAGAGFVDAEESGKLCASVVLTTEEESPGFRKLNAFSAHEIEDLVILVGLNARIEGVKTLKLKMYTPAGHLYRNMETAVGSFEGHVYGVDPGDWLKVFPEKQDGIVVTFDSLVMFRLPVAGTDIVANSLYGEWEIKLFLAEQPMTCGKRFSFKLKP